MERAKRDFTGRAEEIFERIRQNGGIAIDEFIMTRKSEELFLDFKRSADNGTGRVLHSTDRDNLAKAISGFGNSEGGVIVWGVDCSKDKDYSDVAHSKVPIQNVKRFLSWLEGVVSGCTIPPHSGIQCHYISINAKDDGFVISYIPKSIHAPHQVIGKNQYYIRAGSNFVPTPHSVLQGMFGRRPQPHVFHTFSIEPAEFISGKIKMRIGFMIRNDGPGIATDLFMNASTFSIPGDNCGARCVPVDLGNWTGQFTFGRFFSMISKPEFRLPPESFVQPFIMEIWLSPPFSKDLEIHGICGCSQSPSYKFEFRNDHNSIRSLFNEFYEKFKRGIPIDMHDIVKQLLKTEIEEP